VDQDHGAFKGRKVVVYRPFWVYFLTRFGLVRAAALEDRPGRPASPGHLVRVVQQMKSERVKVLLVEPLERSPARGARRRGGGCSGSRDRLFRRRREGADDYLAAIDYNVKTLAAAPR
jgi:ABC-type Zn uptake system ZnuABC Zn-binding protein ZnuA